MERCKRFIYNASFWKILLGVLAFTLQPYPNFWIARNLPCGKVHFKMPKNWDGNDRGFMRRSHSKNYSATQIKKNTNLSTSFLRVQQLLQSNIKVQWFKILQGSFGLFCIEIHIGVKWICRPNNFFNSSICSILGTLNINLPLVRVVAHLQR